MNDTPAFNRAAMTRRDTDSQKSLSISLYDIDETILNHLNDNLKLQVTSGGTVKSVKAMFGSPELWKAMQKDSFVRDYQGKFQLPAIVLKRTTSESDDQVQLFNRYLSAQVIRTYSPKNKYTRFSVLSDANVPVNEIYNISFPSHMKLTYHFIMWTDTMEQMNKLVEAFQYNTKDYWGNKVGYKFRVSAPSFGHTVELQADDDRMVKTEFDLDVHGYILPETITKLDSQESTVNKVFTPKKIILGMEVVGTDFNFDAQNSNIEKWKSQYFPNKDATEIIPTPTITLAEGITDNSIINSILSTLNKSVTIKNNGQSAGQGSGNVISNNSYLTIVNTPPSINAFGQEGEVSYDDRYFYIYTGNQWRRVAISSFS